MAYTKLHRETCDQLGCTIIGPSQISRSTDGSHTTFGARAFQHDADLVLEIHRVKGEDGRWLPDCALESLKTREIRPWGKFAARTDFATGHWYSASDGSA